MKINLLDNGHTLQAQLLTERIGERIPAVYGNE